jgi:hypothetical protein
MDRDEENTKLLERILEAIKEGNKKLDQLVQNTNPKPSDDIASLAVTVDKPIKQ